MDLSYAKLRRVLSVCLKNHTFRLFLEELIANNGSEISELELLDLFDEAEADLEVLEILTDKSPETIPPDEAIDTFRNFFCIIKNSWKRLQPLLEDLGLKVQAEIQKT